MPVTIAKARKLALSLEDVSEAPHFDRAAFKTRRIFATLGAGDMNLMFDPPRQEFYCEQAPDAMAPVPGGWGGNGATRCDLKRVDEKTLLSAPKAAHARASAPPPKRAVKKATKRR
ncbi:MAG TPA: MmcQ/YjbR family DNA-binding protein [Vitreimonas sp.]|jgi:hypothetical protein|nr:MmcQ/YjbR family DNA-binding protein [Vitreimonas sp.]